MGDRWSHLILQAAFQGATRYEDFRLATDAPRNTLSGRLRGLIANGLLEQRPSREGGARQYYYLTTQGADLFDWMLLVWSWGIRWDAVTPNGPAELIHNTCGKAMLPLMVCRRCGGSISLHACSYQDGPGAGDEETTIVRLHRRRQTPSENGEEFRAADLADIICDRWTGLVVSVQYFGLHKFDDIQLRLDIATNILTDRLRALVAAGVFERRKYAYSPPRYEYRMTTKGKDLYAQAMALMLWADRWLLGDEPKPMIVTHNHCGHAIDADIICSECLTPLTRETVTLRRPKARKRNVGPRPDRALPIAPPGTSRRAGSTE